MCFACWLSQVEPMIDPRFTISTILLAGVQVLSRLKGPTSWCFQGTCNSVPRGAHGNTHASAFFSIAMHIGLSIDQIMDDDTVSPFATSRVPW